MSMENVTWMEGVLEENQEKTMKFVNMHHPVHPDELDDGEVRDAFLDALSDHEVDAVFAGHVHSNRDIYDAHGDDAGQDPTEAERPLHVSTGDLVKTVMEYRLVRIDGDEFESMTYDLDGDGERDDKAGIPLGGISVEYTPENDGTNREVTAVIENDRNEFFEDAFIDFRVPPPRPGYEYEVENATVFEEIETGEEKIFYARTDLEKGSTQEVTIEYNHFVDTEPPSDIDLNSATLNGRIYSIDDEVEPFIRYRPAGENEWEETTFETTAEPTDFSHTFTDLDPLHRYEFKAGITVMGEDDHRDIIGDTLNFVPADLVRTTQVEEEWSSYEEMEGLDTDWNDLSLEMIEEDESFEFTGEKQVIPIEDYSHMDVEMLGAGGGGAVHGGDWTGGIGGDGGSLEAVFDVSDFDELHLYVGEGGQTGDGSSTTINEGGWGGSHGGDTLDETYNYGSPHAGAGGGSTEIVGVRDDGTEVWLAAADAGGGGGEAEDIDMIGVEDRSIGGGGGGAGGQGGDILDDEDWGHGDDAQIAEEGNTPREGLGDGGDGGDASIAYGEEEEHMAWPGEPGGYEYNEDYLLELIEANVGGHTGSGGNTNYNHGEHDPFRDGEHGKINADFRDLGTVQGERTSEPLELDGLEQIEENLITWNATTPGTSEIEIHTAITDGEIPSEDDWNEAEKGGPIPGLSDIEDPSGKYLWNRQIFKLNDSTSLPTLHSMTEAILETPPTDFEVSNLRISDDEVYVGEETELSVDVKNEGYESGDYRVDFFVKDDLIDSRTVSVEGLDEETVSVDHSESYPGIYEAKVEDLDAEFTVYDHPEVETREPSSITPFSAELKGELTDLGLEDEVSVYFRYREDGENVWMETDPRSIEYERNFDEVIENLEEETTYEFKAVMEWNGEEEVGETETFTSRRKIEVKDLNVEPEELYYYYEEFKLKAEICNHGNEEEEYRASFKLKGEKIGADTVTVPGGESVNATINYGPSEADIGEDVTVSIYDPYKQTELEEHVVIADHPEVTTVSVDEGTDEAYFSGEVVDIGLEEEVSGYFRWRKIGETDWKETDEQDIGEEKRFDSRIEDLEEEIEYEFKAVIEWEHGIEKCEEIEFTTLKTAFFEVSLISPEEDEVFRDGTYITVNYTVTNTGDVEDYQEVEFYFGDEMIESEEINLESEENYTGEFDWLIEEGSGDHRLRIESLDDEDEVSLAVESEETFFSQYWYIPLIAAIVVLTIVLFVLKKRKEEEEEEGEEDEEDDENDEDEKVDEDEET